MTKLSFEQKVKIREDFGIFNANPFDLGMSGVIDSSFQKQLDKLEKIMIESEGGVEVEFVFKKPMKVRDIAIKYNCSKTTIYNVLKNN
tara:strand:- start:626 stop:889 length:264 start_codon:yes stop_codon:yes gene_type:complete